MLSVNERVNLDRYITREPEDDQAICRCERHFDPADGVCFRVGCQEFAYCPRCLPESYLESAEFIYSHLFDKGVSGSYLEWAMKLHNAISEMI